MKTTSGETITLPISASNTVESVKTMLQVRMYPSIPSDQQRLVFEGTQLQNEFKVCDYKIQTESTLYLGLQGIMMVYNIPKHQY